MNMGLWGSTVDMFSCWPLAMGAWPSCCARLSPARGPFAILAGVGVHSLLPRTGLLTWAASCRTCGMVGCAPMAQATCRKHLFTARHGWAISLTLVDLAG
jgi:hypothetical protein